MSNETRSLRATFSSELIQWTIYNQFFFNWIIYGKNPLVNWWTWSQGTLCRGDLNWEAIVKLHKKITDQKGRVIDNLIMADILMIIFIEVATNVDCALLTNFAWAKPSLTWQSNASEFFFFKKSHLLPVIKEEEWYTHCGAMQLLLYKLITNLRTHFYVLVNLFCCMVFVFVCLGFQTCEYFFHLAWITLKR